MSGDWKTASQYFWRKNGWGFAVLIIAGLGLGVFKMTEYRFAKQIEQYAVEAVGTVTGKYESKHGSGKKTRYQVSYSFVSPDDPYTNGEQVVSEVFFAAQTEGAAINVRYLPSDPLVSVVDSESMVRNGSLTLLISVALVIGGIIGTAVTVQRARRFATGS